ncbi:hypothetical protein [Cellulomonas marina]|uniref:Uncharacterized protein n=1 Tax=Cellulomonas marina TaxID=988821 RepID=A0A1I1ANG6_9CELL|nr:hypothetical protein [Cellulomonas marina]GIG30454.1 hypothetical protein Cma02nite_30540 [Cellulomonas marina]SFB39032.1 hypothetical protein SAMN05421867_12012 [Cellulomonas marina]
MGHPTQQHARRRPFPLTRAVAVAAATVAVLAGCASTGDTAAAPSVPGPSATTAAPGMPSPTTPSASPSRPADEAEPTTEPSTPSVRPATAFAAALPAPLPGRTLTASEPVQAWLEVWGATEALRDTYSAPNGSTAVLVSGRWDDPTAVVARYQEQAENSNAERDPAAVLATGAVVRDGVEVGEYRTVRAGADVVVLWHTADSVLTVTVPEEEVPAVLEHWVNP